MKKIKNYKITKESYKSKNYVWDAKLEVYLSLFVERLCKVRPQFKYNNVTKEILEKYVRKKANSKVSSTKIMREVLTNDL